MIGKTLAHYRILEKLGEGGMGEVYRARDTKLDRDVALKVLPADLAQDPERRKRFEREAKAVAALRHPNIVMIHSVEQVDGVHFITMELVEGQALSDSLPDDGLPLKRFFDYAIELSDALGAAHAKGIAHRDLKPANIMVDADGRLRVLDFGLAKLFQPDLDSDKTVGADSETGEGRILGTVSYMSPEQAEGQSIDHRSDVFSLGIILYEMATGKKPFKGKTNISTISSIIKDDPPSVSEVRHTLPRHLGRIVSHCLAKEPDRRYQSVLDVRNELEALKGEVSSGEIEAPVRVPRPGLLSNKMVRMGGIAVAGIIAIVAVVMLLPKRDSGKLPTTTSSTTGRPATATDALTDQSIAVLPFANMSDDKNNEFFSDGLAEELLNLLSKVPGLRVAARTSSFHFKGHTGSVAEIAEQLHVSTILEGSVRRAGNRVRVTAQLVKAEDGFHMWSETYDRELDDIFAIQEDIATRVVEALKITLMGADAAKLAKKPTDNMEAYDAYLLGLQRMARRQSEALEEAVKYYTRAVDLDPGFAQAYAQLGVTYLLLQDYGSLGADEAHAMAADMIGEALELDDQLGEAYAALGLLKANKSEPEAAEAAYNRAIELNPNHALAYMWYATLKRGNDQEMSWELLNKSLELDPLAPVANVNVGFWLGQEGKPQEALKQFQHVAEIDPGFPSAYAGMAWIDEAHLDDPAEALKWRRKVVELDPTSLQRRMALGWGFYNAGRTEDATETFQGVINVDPGFARAYAAVASIHRDRGRLDDAIRWQKKAIERDRAETDYVFGMIITYLDLDDEASAIQWIEYAEEKFPGVPFIVLGHAIVAEYSGDIKESEEIWRGVGEKFPGWFRDEVAHYDLLHDRVDDARARYDDKRYAQLLEDADPAVNGSNLEDAINLCYVLGRPEDRKRRELLVDKCEQFVLSRSPTVRRNRYSWTLFEIRVLQDRIDEALSEVERAFSDGAIVGWPQRVDPAVRAVLDNPRWEALVEKTRAEVAVMRAELAAEGLAVQ